MIEVKEGPAPFVIDRMLPRGVFQRIHGSFDLVADPDDKTKPWTFDTADEAVTLVREKCSLAEIDGYDWIIRPLLDTQIPERVTEGSVQ